MIEYTHNQLVASNTWTVQHGLNSYPATDVVVMFDGQRTKILPASVEYVNSNRVLVRFSEPQIGAVRCIGGFKFALTTNNDATDIVGEP